MPKKNTDIRIRRMMVERYMDGEAVEEIAKEAGVTTGTIYRWIRDVRAEQAASEKGEGIPLTQKMYNQLKEHVEKLEGIITILKIAGCTVDAPLDVKLSVLERLYHEEEYSVRMLCEALEVPRGTFYNHLRRNKRNNTVYAKRKEELRHMILEVFHDSNQVFGAPKIHAILKNRGEKVALETVRILMREMGLQSIRYGSKKYHLEQPERRKNILKQSFVAERPNQIWVSDVTYYRFNEKQYFICAVLDLFARKIVACRIGYGNNTRFVKATFQDAFESRKPDVGLVFHSDQGSNYRSRTFCDYLKKNGVVQSFSAPGTPHDNSVMETFFASLKREELYPHKYRSEREFRAAVERYIEFYNAQRPHKTLRYKTPNQKEMEYVTAAAII